MTKLAKKGIRLMVYDSTDTKTNMSRIAQAISEGTIEKLGITLPDDVDLSEFEVPVGLTQSWQVGGAVYKALGRIDKCAGFTNWSDALDWILEHDDIAEIQYWGHGGPGRVYMLEDGYLDFKPGPNTDKLKLIGKKLSANARVWFRCCSVFHGPAGHAFAKRASAILQCRVIAHTFIVAFFHAGTHSLMPGKLPTWKKAEGGASVVSSWSSPNRLWFMSNEVPDEW